MVLARCTSTACGPPAVPRVDGRRVASVARVRAEASELVGPTVIVGSIFPAFY
jgi:hypothetical protein